MGTLASVMSQKNLAYCCRTVGQPGLVPDEPGISHIPVGLPGSVPDKPGISHIPVGQT
jgi:hypothetical protein